MVRGISYLLLFSSGLSELTNGRVLGCVSFIDSSPMHQRTSVKANLSVGTTSCSRETADPASSITASMKPRAPRNEIEALIEARSLQFHFRSPLCRSRQRVLQAATTMEQSSQRPQSASTTARVLTIQSHASRSRRPVEARWCKRKHAAVDIEVPAATKRPPLLSALRS